MTIPGVANEPEGGPLEIGVFFFWGVGNLDILGCDIGGAEELGVIYFPTIWGAKELQNLPNHRVDIDPWRLRKPLKGKDVTRVAEIDLML